jgi:hypothetical protein
MWAGAVRASDYRHARNVPYFRMHCLLWVGGGHMRPKKQCPLYPRKQTCAVQLSMSASGQKRTSVIRLPHLPRNRSDAEPSCLLWGNSGHIYALDPKAGSFWFADRPVSSQSAHSHTGIPFACTGQAAISAQRCKYKRRRSAIERLRKPPLQARCQRDATAQACALS